MDVNDPYFVLPPESKQLPIVVSSPHSGTAFPKETLAAFKPEFVERPPDTDWFVDKLYEFAPEMGITLIKARYSRYVIDLNRDPHNSPLYADQRRETTLVPTQSFDGKALYLDSAPDETEIERRKKEYYWPYYAKVSALLEDLKKEYDHVLFFDAHSIRSVVPTIQSEPFKELILGNQDGLTAKSSLSDAVSEVLKESGFSYSYNHPFRGGHLTRYFGQPNQGVHALQLEMSQRVYMNEEEITFDAEKADRLREVLKKIFLTASEIVRGLS